MAVTATFKADFSDFTDKVNKAEKDLKGLETSAAKTGTTTTKSFSDMTSGLGKLGGLLGVTFSIGAVVAFSKSIATAAGEIEKLAAKTGLSFQAVQRFQVVADAAGNSVDQLAAAVSGMQKLLVTGQSTEALAKLGIEISKFRAMAPEQQFYTLAAAIKAVEDPALRLAAATETGGKAMAAVLPSIVRGFEDVREASVGMSDTAVKAWADLGNASVSTLRTMKDAVGTWSGETIAAFKAVFGSAAADLAFLAKSTKDQVGGLTPAAPKGAVAGIPALPVPDPGQQVGQLRELIAASEQHAAAMTKQDAAARQYAAALADVTSYGGDFHSQLQELNGETVAAVKYYADAGASLSQLATVYGLTDREVRAITADMKFQESVVTQTSKAFANVSTSIANAEAHMRSFQATARGLAADGTLINQQIDLMGAATTQLGVGMQGSGAIIDEVMGRNKSSMMDFFGKALSGMQGLGVGVSGLIGAFTGSGGVAGAATSMAKSVAGSLMGMIPIVGPMLSQFAGPLVDGFKALHGKIVDGFKAMHGKIMEMFGGPSADELAGREVVDKFQANLGSMLSETQKIEAGNVEWKSTVIAIRDAYLAQGLTAEEAMADAERLWAATSAGAEASKAVVAEVEQKMKGMADQTKAATESAQGLADALKDVGRAAANIDFPSGTPSVGVPGYAKGTGGRFVNFGQGTLALLHGQERVMTKDEAPGADPAMLAALQAIRRDLQRQPELIALQLRAALAQA